jgi:hypothetical protein
MSVGPTSLKLPKNCVGNAALMDKDIHIVKDKKVTI